jgi:hypothetical protein
MAHGNGIETNESGRIIHDGMWQNDEPVDKMRRLSSTKAFFSTQSLGNIMNIPASTVVAAPLSSQVTNKSTAEASSKKPPMTYQPADLAPVKEQDQLEPVVNVRLHDAHGRKGTFRGMVLNGVPHSVGHMIYSDASSDVLTYQGFWEYGDWKQGRVEYRNGDTFHGDWSHNIRVREGHGTFYYPNGDTFEGSCRNNKRQGLGRFQFQDGSLFEGGFDRGEFHGPGCKYVHRDGRIYIGDFVRGLRSGYGKETYPDGTLRYEGEWIEDEPLHSSKVKPPPEGFVLLEPEDDGDKALNVSNNNNNQESDTKSSTSIPAILVETKDCTTVVAQTVKDAMGNEGMYTGLVRSGLPHGVGRMVYASEIREGFWRDGRLEGHARAFFRNGDFYEGHFVRSQRQGKGVYKWTDGRIYEGDYLNDQRHGNGRFIYPSGDEYVGDYFLGQRQGKGKFTFADGSSYNGEWQQSVYHGYGELKEVNGSTYKGEWRGGLRHGKGEQQRAVDGRFVHGEWIEDSFVEPSQNTSPSSEEAEISKTVRYTVEGVAQQNSYGNDQTTTGKSESLLKWGSLDGENNRWNSNSQELEINDMLAATTSKTTSSFKEVTSANGYDGIEDELVPSVDATMESASVAVADPVVINKENKEDDIDIDSDSRSLPVEAPTISDIELKDSSVDKTFSEPNSTSINLLAQPVPAGEVSMNSKDDNCNDNNPTATSPIVTAEDAVGDMNVINYGGKFIENDHSNINAEMSLVGKIEKTSISETIPIASNPTGSLMLSPTDDETIPTQNAYSAKVAKHPTKFVKTPPSDDE